MRIPRTLLARLLVTIVATASLAVALESTPAYAAPSGMNVGTLATTTDGRLEAFGVAPYGGSSGALFHDYQFNGKWSGWKYLGAPPGDILAGPVIGRNPDGRLEAFIINGTADLYHMWQDGSADNGWSGWSLMHDFATYGGLAVNNDASGNLTVMVTGDKHLWQFRSEPGAWVTTDLGQPGLYEQLSGTVALGRNTDGRFDVFAIGGPFNSQQATVYRRWQVSPGGAWSGWVVVGRCTGPGARSMSVANNQDGRLELFVTSPVNSEYQADICHMWQDPNQSGGWSGWNDFGDATLDGTLPVTSITGNDGRIELFAMRTGGTLVAKWQMTQNGGWNNGYFSHGGGFTGGLAVGKNGDGRLELLAFKNGVPYHSWQNAVGGAWSGWIPLDAG